MGTSTLEFEVKRITRLNGQSSIKAFCDVSINGSFLLKGIKVVDGKKGLFVSMPRQQSNDQRWHDVVIPLTKDTKIEIARIILDAFHASRPAAASGGRLP